MEVEEFKINLEIGMCDTNNFIEVKNKIMRPLTMLISAKMYIELFAWWCYIHSILYVTANQIM
mgnify:CR=1 FL=1